MTSLVVWIEGTNRVALLHKMQQPRHFQRSSSNSCHGCERDKMVVRSRHNKLQDMVGSWNEPAGTQAMLSIYTAAAETTHPLSLVAF